MKISFHEFFKSRCQKKGLLNLNQISGMIQFEWQGKTEKYTESH